MRGMRRAILEWGGLFSLTVAIALISYWAVSIQTRSADITLTIPLGHSSFDLRMRGGTITFCDNVFNLYFIAINSGPGPFKTTPAPVTVQKWNLPGFHYRRVYQLDGTSNWSLELSLLIPATVMLSIGGYCFWRLRRNRDKRATTDPVVRKTL